MRESAMVGKQREAGFTRGSVRAEGQRNLCLRDIIVLIALLTLKKILKHKTMLGKKKSQMKGRMKKCSINKIIIS